MAEITQVRTEADYAAALARISELLGAEPYSPDDVELDRLSTLVESYETEHYPMGSPTPSGLLEFLIDQQIVSREQALSLAGGKASLDAMLAGQQAITPDLAQLLHKHSGVPVDDLLLDSVDSQENRTNERALVT